MTTPREVATLVSRLVAATEAGDAVWRRGPGPSFELTRPSGTLTIEPDGSSAEFLLRLHDHEGAEVWNYDGRVGGPAGSPQLRPRAELRRLFLLVYQQVRRPSAAIDQFLEEL